MLHLENLSHLDIHQHFLQKRAKTPNLFLVGGCVRDLLLGITKNPLDLDFTMAGKPDVLYAGFDTRGLSHFITEKFGTSTFISPFCTRKTKWNKAGTLDKERNPYPLQKEGARYELTPLRTEGDYGDFRHPGELQRSNDLILDSQRRDFTINAMYYFSITQQMKAILDFTQAEKQIDEKSLIRLLEKEGYCYIANLNLLILRKEQYIQQVFGGAKFDETYFRYLVETQREGYDYALTSSVHPKSSLSTRGLFRVLIDSTGGLNGLVERRLETVGEADKRFGEDALRLMRALRIVNVMNHSLTISLKNNSS